jgi:hypothetical protein
MRDTLSSRVNSEIFVIAPSDGCLATANLLSLDASRAIPTCILRFEVSGRKLLQLRLRFFGLGFVD